MDMLSNLYRSNSPKPAQRMVTDPLKSWPHVPAVDGKYYGSVDKHGARLIVMTQGTWEQLGTIIESLRTTARGQDVTLKQQSQHIQDLTADRNQLLERHTNLQSNHRELLRERAGKDMNLDHASDYTGNLFSPKGPKK